MRVHLITAESPESRRLRHGRLIQFPQLTMPLIAALTSPEHAVSHTDEIVERVRFDVPADLVGITAPTPSALHAYGLAREFRRRGVPVVIGGPHATALPEEATRHADGVVVGEAEDTWPRVLDDARRGRLEPVYVSTRRAPLAGMPAPRWDLIKRRRYGKSVTIATRGRRRLATPIAGLSDSLRRHPPKCRVPASDTLATLRPVCAVVVRVKRDESHEYSVASHPNS